LTIAEGGILLRIYTFPRAEGGILLRIYTFPRSEGGTLLRIYTFPHLKTLKISDAESKSSSSPDPAITAPTLTQLTAIKTQYNSETAEMNAALQEQVNASLEEDLMLGICRMHISHFLQVFNLGVHRGVHTASERAFFGLDVSQEELPSLTKENDVIHWALQVKDGEAARVLAGGTAMVNPTALEVETEYNSYKAKHDIQSEKKDIYDDEQQDVAAMFDTVKNLVTDIWDEVEFFYRHEPDEASKRRKCREWGVTYVSRHKATITGVVTDSATSEPLKDVNVSLVEAGEVVQTDEEGIYLLSTNYTGEGMLEFSLVGYTTQTFPVEVHEGGEITQDVSLVAE